ncbi:MAG: hypothetical protein M3R17_10630 [Bacteroidota bacterium]|nr:hypothetical protein [Bacteroidota bacterium]
MNQHATKNSANQSKSIAQALQREELHPQSASTFVDNRPVTSVQRKLQEGANNSSKVKQLKTIQQMADMHSAVAQLSTAPVIQMRTAGSIKVDLAQGAYTAHFAGAFTVNHIFESNTNFKAAKHHAARGIANSTIIADARALKNSLIAGAWTALPAHPAVTDHFSVVGNAAIGIRKTARFGAAFAPAPVAGAPLTTAMLPADQFTLGEEPAAAAGDSVQTVTAITGVSGAELDAAKNSVGRPYPKKDKRATYRGRLLTHINAQRATIHGAAEVAWIHANFSHINTVPLDPAVHTTKALIDAIPVVNSVVTVFISEATGKIYHLENS